MMLCVSSTGTYQRDMCTRWKSLRCRAVLEQVRMLSDVRHDQVVDPNPDACVAYAPVGDEHHAGAVADLDVFHDGHFSKRRRKRGARGIGAVDRHVVVQECRMHLVGDVVHRLQPVAREYVGERNELQVRVRREGVIAGNSGFASGGPMYANTRPLRSNAGYAPCATVCCSRAPLSGSPGASMIVPSTS